MFFFVFVFSFRTRQKCGSVVRTKKKGSKKNVQTENVQTNLPNLVLKRKGKSWWGRGVLVEFNGKGGIDKESPKKKRGRLWGGCPPSGSPFKLHQRIRIRIYIHHDLQSSYTDIRTLERVHLPHRHRHRRPIPYSWQHRDPCRYC